MFASRRPIGLVHAVTRVAGARTLLGYLPTVSIEQMYAQLWQLDAANPAGFTHMPNGAAAHAGGPTGRRGAEPARVGNPRH